MYVKSPGSLTSMRSLSHTFIVLIQMFGVRSKNLHFVSIPGDSKASGMQISLRQVVKYKRSDIKKSRSNWFFGKRHTLVSTLSLDDRNTHQAGLHESYILAHIIGNNRGRAGFNKDLTIIWLSKDIIRPRFFSLSLGFFFLYAASFRKTPCKSWQEGRQQFCAFISSLQKLHWIDKSPGIKSHCTEFYHIPILQTFRMLRMTRTDSGDPFPLQSE